MAELHVALGGIFSSR